MSVESRTVYSVPTHLQEREPFAFGRTVGEIAKLVAIGFVAARLVSSNDLPGPVRMPAAATLLLIGAAWALVRVQRRPLDWWLELAFRYGVRPKRQVWRSRGTAAPAADSGFGIQEETGLCELEQIRVRWAVEADTSRGHPRDCSIQSSARARNSS
jgi:hypothetical protein